MPHGLFRQATAPSSFDYDDLLCYNPTGKIGIGHFNRVKLKICNSRWKNYICQLTLIQIRFILIAYENTNATNHPITGSHRIIRPSLQRAVDQGYWTGGEDDEAEGTAYWKRSWLPLCHENSPRLSHEHDEVIHPQYIENTLSKDRVFFCITHNALYMYSIVLHLQSGHVL